MQIRRFYKVKVYSLLFLNISIWLKWWRTWHTLPIFNWILGAYYFKNNKFKLATYYYNKGFEKHKFHPAYSCARLDYSYCLYRSGQVLEAKEELYKLSFTNSRMEEAFMLLAEIEDLLGNKYLLMRRLEKCRELFPESIPVLIRYAHASSDNKRYLDNENLLDIRIKLMAAKMREDINSDLYHEIETALAHTELAKGNTEKGERMLARIVVTSTSSYEASILYAKCLLAKGRVRQARRLLTKAMRLQPRKAEPPMLLARTYLANESVDSNWSIQLAETACKSSFWQNLEAMQVLADAYEVSGDATAALLIANKMQELFALRKLNIESLKYFEAQINRLNELIQTVVS